MGCRNVYLEREKNISTKNDDDDNDDNDDENHTVSKLSKNKKSAQ